MSLIRAYIAWLVIAILLSAIVVILSSQYVLSACVK